QSRSDATTYSVAKLAECGMVVQVGNPDGNTPSITDPGTLKPYYPGIACLRGDPIDLKTLYGIMELGNGIEELFQITNQEAIVYQPEWTAEVRGFLSGYGSNGLDAHPADIIVDLLGANYWSAQTGIDVETSIGQ